MENASKALIIAGAILLSILLISLGIMVYQNAKGTIDDANLNTEEAQNFNTKISQYCGNKKSATDMNALVDAITASNGAQSKVAQNERHPISITVSGDESNDYHTGGSVSVSTTKPTPTTAYPRFTNGAKFSASYTTDDQGYISTVTIEITTT